MKAKAMCLFATVLLAVSASVVMGQTKVSGTTHCNAPSPSYSAAVGDWANHTLQLSQNQCEWSKPMEIEGLKAKEAQDTSTADIFKNTLRFRGYDVSTMDNGDKCFVRFQGHTTISQGKPGASYGTWMFTGGTGKLAGIKGKGTFKETTNADGSGDVNIVGAYTLPAKK